MMLTSNLVCCSGMLMFMVLLFLPIGQTNGYLHKSGRHVCTNPQSSQPAPKQMFIESYCQPVFQPYFAMCDGGFRLCTRYRTIYSTGYRFRYSQYQRTDVYRCCPGWSTTNKYASSCTQPICSVACQNGGRCIAPDTCSCANGWTGRQCDQAVCTNACKNNGRCVAPDTCACPRGWSGSLCSKATCFSECQNGGECVGPDLCACPAGWTGKYCDEDINECESSYHECQQTCKNTNGSFACTCHEGFILRMDGKTCQVCLLCSPEFQELAGRVVELEKNLDEMREVNKEKPTQRPDDKGMNLEEMQDVKQGAKRPEDEGMVLIDMALNDQHISQIGRIASLSEQISMLEERLDECTCTYQNGYSRQQPRRRPNNKIKKKR